MLIIWLSLHIISFTIPFRLSTLSFTFFIPLYWVGISCNLHSSFNYRLWLLIHFIIYFRNRSIHNRGGNNMTMPLRWIICDRRSWNLGNKWWKRLPSNRSLASLTLIHSLSVRETWEPDRLFLLHGHQSSLGCRRERHPNDRSGSRSFHHSFLTLSPLGHVPRKWVTHPVREGGADILATFPYHFGRLCLSLSAHSLQSLRDGVTRTERRDEWMTCTTAAHPFVTLVIHSSPPVPTVVSSLRALR